MKLETTTETKASFPTRGEAIDFVLKAIHRDTSSQVSFRDKTFDIWGTDPKAIDRYEVTVVTSTEYEQ